MKLALSDLNIGQADKDDDMCVVLLEFEVGSDHSVVLLCRVGYAMLGKFYWIAHIYLHHYLFKAMSMKVPRQKERTNSFANQRSNMRNSSQKFGYSPDRSESKIDRT